MAERRATLIRRVFARRLGAALADGPFAELTDSLTRAAVTHGIPSSRVVEGAEALADVLSNAVGILGVPVRPEGEVAQ